MNSIEILKSIKCFDFLYKNFRGIFASNSTALTNLKLKRNNFIIYNSCPDSISDINCHWILCYRTRNNIHVHCPAGLSPIWIINSTILKSFLNNQQIRIKLNLFAYQKCLQSQTCGEFNLLFIYLLLKGFTERKIQSIFIRKNCKKSEETIKILFNKIFYCKN